MAAGAGTAVAKKASAPKKTKVPSHPPYSEMVKEALIALKERTGSSSVAIAKHMEEQQKVTLPSNFKKLLSVQLKRLVASGKLIKVKNSFKIAPVEKKSTEESKSKPKANPAAAKSKEVTEKKAKKPVAKKEKAKKVATPVKAKGKTVTKRKAVVKPVKKTVKAAAAKSPAKKMAAVKVKKAIEKAKKPKSIKSPVKKASACKRARK